MEITIFDGKNETARKFIEGWGAAYGNVSVIARGRKKVVVEIDDEEAKELIDRLDEEGMNYEED